MGDLRQDSCFDVHLVADAVPAAAHPVANSAADANQAVAVAVDLQAAVGVDLQVAVGVDLQVAVAVDLQVAVGVDLQVAVAVDLQVAVAVSVSNSDCLLVASLPPHCLAVRAAGCHPVLQQALHRLASLALGVFLSLGPAHSEIIGKKTKQDITFFIHPSTISIISGVDTTMASWTLQHMGEHKSRSTCQRRISARTAGWRQLICRVQNSCQSSDGSKMEERPPRQRSK